MEIIIVIIQILAAILGCLTLTISIPLFILFRWPAAAMWGLKVYVSALSSPLALIDILTTIVGLVTGSVFISLIGIFAVLIYVIHIVSVTRPPALSSNFDTAFGLGWEKNIQPEQKIHFLPGRTILRLPAVQEPRLEQNIAFAIIPGTDRKLLCDVWQPPENVNPSGVAFIYLHGGAWYILDKDVSTRPFFRHLAAQGHVIMDVAYRLAPETDFMGMVQDVKRAIVWMRGHAGTYDINPDRIVVSGGSAGGHLALMAAYTSGNPQFTPKELEGKDVGVCAVISFYGQSDLTTMYYHTNQHLTTRSTRERTKKAVPTKMPGWMIKAFGEDYHRFGFDKDFVKGGSLAPLLGGHPDECPERYALFSPVTHVHQVCPPTLLIHGEHDIMAPIASTRRLYSLLLENNIPAVMHILPQTDHGFDLILPKISPSAHNALYDVERFLALMVTKSRTNNQTVGYKHSALFKA